MVPDLIKGVIASIFSEQAGKDMGAAAASYYRELKAAGMPEEVALRMTENYAKTFTDLGSLIREAMSERGGFKFGKEHPEDIRKIVEEEIRKKLAEKKE